MFGGGNPGILLPPNLKPCEMEPKRRHVHPDTLVLTEDALRPTYI